MESAAVKVRPGDKIRLSKIDPDDTDKLTKKEACARFVARSCVSGMVAITQPDRDYISRSRLLPSIARL
jgi:hypothetical protein